MIMLNTVAYTVLTQHCRKKMCISLNLRSHKSMSHQLLQVW